MRRVTMFLALLLFAATATLADRAEDEAVKPLVENAQEGLVSEYPDIDTAALAPALDSLGRASYEFGRDVAAPRLVNGQSNPFAGLGEAIAPETLDVAEVIAEVSGESAPDIAQGVEETFEQIFGGVSGRKMLRSL